MKKIIVISPISPKPIYIYIYIYIYTATQKFGISKIFYVFKGVSSAHQGCIYLTKNVILLNLIAISNIGFLF